MLGAGQLLGTLRWDRPPALARAGGASRGSTVRVFGGKAALEEALDVSAWRVRGPGAAGGSGMLGMHGGAAGAASLIPGMLLEQEVGMSLARTLPELSHLLPPG